MSREERERIGISPQVRACIDAASDCYTACAETLNYLLNDLGDIPDLRQLRLVIDCREVCQTTEDGMLLTPPSTLRALNAGYQPVLHPSATGATTPPSSPH